MGAKRLDALVKEEGPAEEEIICDKEYNKALADYLERRAEEKAQKKYREIEIHWD